MKWIPSLTLALLALPLATLATESAPKPSASPIVIDDSTSGENPCLKLDNTKPIYNSTTKKFRGCRVTSVKTGSGYDKMGLQTGDIVQPDSSRAKTMEVISGTAGADTPQAP